MNTVQTVQLAYYVMRQAEDGQFSPRGFDVLRRIGKSKGLTCVDWRATFNEAHALMMQLAMDYAARQPDSEVFERSMTECIVRVRATEVSENCGERGSR